jgi:hypothetical protein
MSSIRSFTKKISWKKKVHQDVGNQIENTVENHFYRKFPKGSLRIGSKTYPAVLQTYVGA